MKPGNLTPLAKAMTGLAVAIIEIGLLAFVAPGASVTRAADDGGAPVINLTLASRVAFDGVGGAQNSAAAKGAAEASPMRAGSATVRSRPPSITPQILPAIYAPAPMAADGEAALPAPEKPGLAADVGDPVGAMDARQGLTEGGAGRTIGAAAGEQTDDYHARVIQWVEEHKRHPGRLEGVVVAGFTLDRRGRLRDERILLSSGDRGLDAVTLRQLRDADPFPRPPAEVRWKTRDFRVRLEYRSRQGGRLR